MKPSPEMTDAVRIIYADMAYTYSMVLGSEK